MSCLTACSSGERKKLESGDLDKKEEKTVDNPHESIHSDMPHDHGNDEFRPLQGDIEPFLAPDSVEIHGVISEISQDAPYILLCHQAGYSHGEYKETAAWFNSIGFNTLAISQRSGNEVNGVVNETALQAAKKDSNVTYLDAEQDIKAAIAHIADLLLLYDRERPIYLVGSSYSASLVLKIAADTSFKYHNQIKGVASFSPGEYLREVELTPLLGSIACPVFLTAAKNEMDAVKQLSVNIPEELVTMYEPETESIHGSRALWSSIDGFEACRQALESFYKQ